MRILTAGRFNRLQVSGGSSQRTGVKTASAAKRQLKNKKNRQQGFTLIEMVVVMALISTLTAFALPKIRSSLFTDELRGTARRFIGLIAETGQEARSKRTPLLLRFDRKQNQFTTSSAAKTFENNDTDQASSMKVPESVEVVDISTAHGGTKNIGELAIRFSSRGYVDKTVVHFRDDDGDELSVIISPFLGVTRVLEGYISLDDDRYSIEN